MKISQKISVFVIAGSFLIGTFLGILSLLSLFMNQSDNLKISKNEVLEISRELTQKNADFFFRLLDKKLEGNSLSTPQDILQAIPQIDPDYFNNVIVIDIKREKALKGFDGFQAGEFIDRQMIDSYLNEDILNHKKDFYLDNYNEFLQDTRGVIVPAIVQFRIYDDQGLIVGYGKTMETAKVRIEFMKKKTQGYLRWYIFISSLACILISGVVIAGLIYLMKRTFIRPLEEINAGVSLMARGDLSTRINNSSRDEIGNLARSINMMAEDLQGSTTSIVNLHQEIAERRRVEEALLLSEERFSQVALHSGDWIWEVDAEGYYTYSSPVVERVLGYKPEEILGRSLYDSLAPEEKDKNTHFIKMAVDQKREFVIPIRKSLHKDGHTIILESTAVPVLDNGRLVGYRGVSRDITQRELAQQKLQEAYQELKSTQAQLVQSEKMASIGQLAAGVAHEINNPLGFISNNMEMLEQYIDYYIEILRMVEGLKQSIIRGDIDKAQSIVQKIAEFEEKIDLKHVSNDLSNLMLHTQKGLERIKKIVLDLRTFAREVDDVVDLVRIEEVIDSVLSIAYNEFKYKAELKKDYGDTPLVRCSAQRLGQVFINLMVNASQAIKSKGVIEVKTYKQGKYVCVDVRDTGEGIPPENIKRIFDPFFTTKPVGQGTGLGLSVSHEIIKKHGGEIRVQSRMGEGSTFTVMLPIN